jgi:hypothetical protein
MFGFDVHTETEAAIWAEGTEYTKEDILRAYRDHLDDHDESVSLITFCEETLGIAN